MTSISMGKNWNKKDVTTCKKEIAREQKKEFSDKNMKDLLKTAAQIVRNSKSKKGISMANVDTITSILKAKTLTASTVRLLFQNCINGTIRDEDLLPSGRYFIVENDHAFALVIGNAKGDFTIEQLYDTLAKMNKTNVDVVPKKCKKPEAINIRKSDNLEKESKNVWYHLTKGITPKFRIPYDKDDEFN